MSRLRLGVHSGQEGTNHYVELPLTVGHEKTAFLAKTGAGKTYCASVLAEEMLKAKIPIIVVDPMGVWWGLQVNRDGKSKGYPVVVFGGEHANLPLDESKAAELAQAIVGAGISAVIDVADLSHSALQKFMTPFLRELLRVNREDRHIFIEEADVIAPQKPQRDETVLLGAVDNLVRRGGNHNIGTTLLSQRSAVVNKNVLSQSDYLVVLKTSDPRDKEAVAAWAVRRTKNKAELNAWLDTLDELEPGEAYLWGTGMNVPGIRMHFRERETFHATRENLKQAAKIKPMDVSEFVAKYLGYFKGEDEELPEHKLKENYVTVDELDDLRHPPPLGTGRKMVEAERGILTPDEVKTLEARIAAAEAAA